MRSRGWTAEQIDEAVKSGSRIDARNKENGNPATRYVSPTTGRSVVIDNATNEVIQVGEDNFKFDERSGDLPGAVMRPPPGPAGSDSGGGGGGGGPAGGLGGGPFGHERGIIPEEPLE